MEKHDINAQEDERLKKPVKSSKQKLMQIAASVAVIILFVLFGIVIPQVKKASAKNHSNSMQNSKEIIMEELPKPKLMPVKERIKQYKAQETKTVEEEDIVTLVEKQQQQKETLEKAHFLARIETARVKAEECEKMVQSSVLSGIGVGVENNKTSLKAGNQAVYENGNTAFLARVGSESIKEEEAGMLGDLRFRITEGKIIKGVIDGAIDSDLPDSIRAHVTEDVYGDQGNIVLIPNGARLIGQYRSGKMKNGQTRVFIVWTRLIEPNGVTVNLSSTGSDELGRGGMTGHVNKHHLERYGSAMLMSMLSAGSSLYGASTKDQYNSISQFRNNMSQSFSNMADVELQENTTIQNTINIPQGTPLTIKVSHDISFEAVIQEMGGTW